MTANDCNVPGSRLFVTDQKSKHRFLIDTGSDLSCFPTRLLPERRPATNYDLSAANDTTIKTYGFLNLDLILGLRRSFVWRFVVADVSISIIGSDFLAHYHLLPDCQSKRLIDTFTGLQSKGQTTQVKQNSVKTIHISSPCTSLLTEFQEITRPAGLPRIVKHKTVHHIRTSSGPPVYSRPRRLAPEKLKIAKKEFAEMLLAGTIRPSDSPWSSPLHLAPKGDNGWRPCGDYRALNARTIPDKYSSRHIHDFTHNISGSKVFSTIDLLKAYQQIPINPDDVCKTAITTPFGSYEFLFMTFGLRNAGNTFQRLMDEILFGLDFCFTYM